MPSGNPSHIAPTGPPQASAAHARARASRLFSQLRHSILFKITLATGALLLITALPILFGRPAWPLFWLWRIAFSISLFVLMARVAHHAAAETLWLLRNRLLLAYVFVGVVPVLLIAGMLALGAYVFYGQYATYLLVSAIQERTKNVGAVNTLTLRELERHPGSTNQAGLSNYYASYYFPRGYGGVHSFFWNRAGQPEDADSQRSGPLAPWLQSGFDGFITQRRGYSIASYGASAAGERVLTLYSLNPKNWDSLTAPIGEVNLRLTSLGANNLPADDGAIAIPPRSAPLLANTITLRPRSSLFDIEIVAAAFIPTYDWTTGQPRQLLASIRTRPSLLNQKLFSGLQRNDSSNISLPMYELGIVAFFFLVIEVFSLVAGIRLTRTITVAVNDLYIGTEHVNRGDFEHRIPVRTRDQLAALEISFNNMTGSISRLLDEQRQKQRLENELTIAHEVQAQLFPRIPPSVPGLEIFGRCLAARVVSGDYYDFLQLGPNRVSLALGDISGKGISAALLMATIVAAVRAYQPSLADAPSRGFAAGAPAGFSHRAAPAALDDDQVSPALLLERLNNQLFHSTPPEKYATLFYAVYDGDRRLLRYTNAGHLPPVVVGAAGARRLERGGMVVGLFEGVRFEEGVVELHPGDLLAAWSDGITEPENDYGVEFGESRLIQLLEQNRARPLAEIADAILAAAADWSGGEEQADDITLVLARVPA